MQVRLGEFWLLAEEFNVGGGFCPIATGYRRVGMNGVRDKCLKMSLPG